MAYESKYDLLNSGNTQKGLTLYEAVKALKEVAKAGKLTDGTCVKSRGRHVAFFCEHRNEVRAMFQANDQEREVLKSWAPVRC